MSICIWNVKLSFTLPIFNDSSIKIITILIHASLVPGTQLEHSVGVDLIKDAIKSAEKNKYIVEEACKNIFDLKRRRWKKLSADQKKCGFIDLEEKCIFIDSFDNIPSTIVELRFNDITSRVESKYPKTFHARMLYSCGLWEEYVNLTHLNFHEGE